MKFCQLVEYPMRNIFFKYYAENEAEELVLVHFLWHGVKVGPGPRDPPQSLKVGLGTPLKFKSETAGPHPKFKSGTLGSPSKFKSGTLVIIFLHCLTYFVPDKYIYNMEIIFHE